MKIGTVVKRLLGFGTRATARFKAHVVGEGLSAQGLEPDQGAQTIFSKNGALEPPYPLDQLAALLLTSNCLRQNIEAYVVNVDSAGWRAVPTVDLWGPNSVQAVTELLTMQSGGQVPNESEVKTKTEEWRVLAMAERAKMAHFFEFLNPEDTWTGIRGKVRFDYELLGNGAMEFVRNQAGNLGLVAHLPFVNVRAMPLDEPVRTDVNYKSDPITVGTITITRRYRRYIQSQDGLEVWFKEFGDPRVVSSKTGLVYKAIDELAAKEPGVTQATEILPFKLYAPNQAYGVPRWTGNMMSVIGSRLSEEVNFLYFENKSVPPLAILISGGRLASDSVSKLESFIENHIKGEGNFHKVLILEAETEGDDKSAGRAQIKLQPLMEAQLQDALFQKYDASNRDKVGASFRLPGALRGEMRDLNRGNVEFALQLAEQQVFGPERDAFDAVVNRKILPRLNIRFWIFKSKAPAYRDPSAVSKILSTLVANGILMPDEARAILPEIGIEVQHRNDEFLREPIRLAIARLRAGMQANGQDQPEDDPANEVPDTEGGRRGGEQARGVGGPGEDPKKRRRRILAMTAKDLVTIRALMEGAEVDAELVKVPATIFREWFDGPDGTSDANPSPVPREA